MIDAVHRTSSWTYSTPGSQNRSLRVIYHREGSIQIDVVPAIWRNRNSQRLVEIPDVEAETWITTCVRRQENLLLKL